MNARETQRLALIAAYANAGGEAVAFIDESYLAPNFEVKSRVEPFYLMTAYVVPKSELQPMRDDLPDVVDATFWHSTDSHRSEQGREKIAQFVSYISEGSEAMIVALKAPISADDTDGEAARAASFRALLVALASGIHCPPVALVIFEERRHMSQRNADERTIKEARRADEIPRSMSVRPASPSDERLLWLPDLVSFALYQRQARTGHNYAEAFYDRVVFIEA